MALRAKSRRRLLVLLIVLAVLILGGGGAYVGRMVYLERKAQQAKREGIELFDRGQYEPALHKLGTYLGRHQDDAEILYKYAVSRGKVEMPGSRHLVQSAQLLQRLLALEPDHPQASRDLLELYDRIGYASEALELADQLLAETGEDPELIRYKARALVRLQKPLQALPLSKKYNQLKPTDIAEQIQTLSMMHRLQASQGEILQRAAALRSRFPDDPRFVLLDGVAHRWAGRIQDAAKLFQQAAGQDAPDAQYTALLAGQLQSLGLYDQAEKLLQDARDSHDPQIQAMYIRRRFQRGDLEEVLARTENLSWAENAAMRARMLTLRAMALMQREDSTRLRATIADLEAQENAISQAWVPYLRTRLEAEPPSPRTVEILTGSLTRLPGDPFLHYFLAEHLNALGETDLALEKLKAALASAGGWHMPFLRAGVLLARRGQYEEAAALAREALRRDSRSVPAALALLRARSRQLSELPAERLESLLDLALQLDEAAPDDPTVQLLQVDLPARLGRKDQAAGKARKLQQRRELSASMRRGLAGLNQRHELGLADLEGPDTSGPENLAAGQALARVLSREDLKSFDPAAAALEDLRRRSSDADSMAWKIARLRLRRRFDPDAAGKAWAAFLDENPESLPALRAALDSPRVWQDRELASRAVEAFRSLSPSQGLQWRIYQARLDMDSRDSADLQRAVELLEHVVLQAPRRFDAQMMLLQCLRRQGNYAKALDRVASLVQLGDKDGSIRLLQAQMMYRHGDKDRARRIVDQLAQGPETSQAVLRGAAQLLASQADPQGALDVLGRLHPDPDAAADLQLAAYQLQAGQPEKAQATARRTLEKDPSARSIVFLARLLAVADRPDEARQVLRRLESLEMPAWQRHLILASFAENHQTLEEARRHYTRAVEAGPDEPATHLSRIRFLLESGQMEPLSQALTQAQNLPEIPWQVEMLSARGDLLEATAGNAAAAEFWLAAIASRDNQQPALEGLQLIRRMQDQTEISTEEVENAGQIARKHPGFLPVQVLWARMSMAIGRNDDAVQWAGRALQDFPEAPEPAWILSQALAAQGLWAQAISAADQWRVRSRGLAAPAADMLIAEGQIQLGRPERAAASLEAYVQQALENPDRGYPLISRYARALILSDKTDSAAKALRPLLATHPRYRREWIALAMLVVPEIDQMQAWLEAVTPLVPADAHSEQIALAEAWFTLGRRAGNAEWIDRAKGILAARTAASPDAAISLGVICDMQGDVARAEPLYRDALGREASEHLAAIAANNLAMILIEDSRELARAETLARRAVQARPNSANFHDTVAQACQARGKHAEAVEMLERAVQLEPAHPKWMLQLAQAQLRAGQKQDARDSLLRLRRIYPESRMLPDELRARLIRLDKELQS